MSDIVADDVDQDIDESWSEQQVIQAIVLIEDAYSFRSIEHKLLPSNVLKYYRIYWSKWVQRLLSFIVSCQLLLIFIQYPSSLSRTSDLRQEQKRITLPCSLQLIIEYICLIIFYMDGFIRIYLTGWKNARKKPWIITYFVVTTISMIDLIISTSLGCTKKTINIRVLLRPFYMAAISQEMKKIVNSLRKSFLQILSVTILLGIHVYFFSIIGMILFPPAKNPLNDRADEGTKYFPDFPDSLLNLIILLTTANNPDITIPAYSKNRLYIIYFAVFLTIGLYCLMTLFTVIKMNTFKEFFTTSMQNSLFRRRLAVCACFDVLLERQVIPSSVAATNDGTTTSLLTRQLSRATVPVSLITRVITGSNIPQVHKKELINTLTRTASESNEITWETFSMAMLLLDADLPNPPTQHHQYTGLWAVVQLIGASKYLTWFGNSIGLINFILLVIEGGLRYHPNFLKIDVILSNILFSFCIYYFLEAIFKFWSLRAQTFFKYLFNTFDACLAITLFILHITHLSIYKTLSLTTSEIDRDSHGTASSIWAVTRIINLLVIFRVIRSMPHVTNYGIIMGTITDGMRNLKAFIGILICLFYSYAVLGMWLFRGVIKAPTDADLANATCGSYQQSNYWANNFDDFFSTIVILYNVMLVNNWGIFLTALREFSTRWSQLYLVTWWYLSNVYVLALVLGFIVELFSLNVARYEESGVTHDHKNLASTYFVKTLFHLFKRSLKEPTDAEISNALQKYKQSYQNMQQ